MNDAQLHQAINETLTQIKDPESGRSLFKTGQLSKLTIADGVIDCELAISTSISPIAEEFIAQVQSTFIAAGARSVNIVRTELKRSIPPIGQIGLRVKNVIAVGAGKGGVGKSTVAASLALTLDRLGAKVGLMDADVYGPSIPHLLGLSGRPEILDGKIQPIKSGNIPVISMGFLLEKDQAVIWRGPMLHGSITQFLRDTEWGELDYLIIDLPPGTGDVVLTLSQLLPLAGAVVVCTPQEVALLDASKAIAMFQKTKTPLLGIVENMSGFICPDNGKTYDIFGRGGARKKAEEVGIPFLGEVPINISLREKSDEGGLAAALNDPLCAAPLESVARAVVRSLSDEAIKRGGISAPLPVL